MAIFRQKLVFNQLNHGWNAEPNAPLPEVEVSGADIVLRFYLNAFGFARFAEGEKGSLRFKDCARYRLGSTNDEGWSLGQCRYSKTAPQWGEFYELSGPDPRQREPNDWREVSAIADAHRHFLFYLRDETFECFASDWVFEDEKANALYGLECSFRIRSDSLPPSP